MVVILLVPSTIELQMFVGKQFFLYNEGTLFQKFFLLKCLVSLLKILNSRWVSSSRDVVALRQTLLNPSSCSEFTAFVAVKGDTLESNVHFWLEVQKFKVKMHDVS